MLTGLILKQLFAARDDDVGALPLKEINRWIAKDPNFAGIRITDMERRLAELKTRGLVVRYKPGEDFYLLTLNAYLVMRQWVFDVVTTAKRKLPTSGVK